MISGECRWDEPEGQGVVISRASNPRLTQWWELYVSFVDPLSGDPLFQHVL